MSDNKSIRIERHHHVAWLIMARPEKRNALGTGFFDELEERACELDRDPEVRVVVIRAEGKSFTAGIDLADLSGMLQGGGARDRETVRRTIVRFQESISWLERCRKPVIAAIHGHCIGGGVDLACACDIRMASRDAVFSIRETRMGIIADLGTLQRFPSLVGQGWFMELALTGRDFSADEALRMGFITRLSEGQEGLIEEASRLAEDIAALPPLAVQGVKDVAFHSRDFGVQAGLQYVAQKNAAQLPSEDLMEAIQAFREKRPPQFKGK